MIYPKILYLIKSDDSLEDYIYNTNDLSDYIYDQSKLHRFDIIISQENLNLINNDPTAEQYVDASFIFEDKIIKMLELDIRDQ